MKVTSKGYDPDLGAKFASESNGLVIARKKSLPEKSDEPSRFQDPQEQHDEMLPDLRSRQAEIETEKDGIKAEALRRLKVRQLSKAQPGRTRGSSK